MSPITIGRLRRLSGKAIGALPGPTAIKSGDRVLAILIPADEDRLRAFNSRTDERGVDRPD